VDLFLNEGYKGMDLRRLNRCRLALRSIFLSDIVTADGRRLEDFVMHSRVGRDSIFSFPREHPSDKDWALWDDFWTSWCLPNGTVPTVLGEWIQRSHQKWQWFYDEDAEALWEHDQSAWIEYRRMTPGQATRGSLRFTPIKVWTNREESGIPVSVKRSANTVHLLNKGPHFEETIQSPSAETFWEFVARQGGNWIWEYIEGKHKDMSWIASALYDGSAIMVTDGSYNRTLAPRISGAGWVLVSTNSLKMVYGAFYEVSSAASSYRGELLGLTAIHHLVAFVLEFYTTPTARGSIHCDNKGALHQAATNRKRVRPKTKHSDLIRNLRHIKATHKFEVCYLHVKAHLDDHLSWDQLSVVQQLNVHCDLLAKQAVQDYISQPID
jgi:hypothetical protein